MIDTCSLSKYIVLKWTAWGFSELGIHPVQIDESCVSTKKSLFIFFQLSLGHKVKCIIQSLFSGQIWCLYIQTAWRGIKLAVKARKEHQEQAKLLFEKRQQKDSAHSLRSLSTNVLFSRFPGSCKLVFTIDAVRSEGGWGLWKLGEGTLWGTVPIAPPAAAGGLVWSYLNKTHSTCVTDILQSHVSHTAQMWNVLPSAPLWRQKMKQSFPIF